MLKRVLCTIAFLVTSISVVTAGSSMQLGGRTSQPIGHYNFCEEFEAECQPVKNSNEVPNLTEYGWDIVREVNRAVNEAIFPKTDLELFGKEEFWTYPITSGDCEDYVLLKRKMLMEHGFSPGNVLITIVRRPNGEGHAVLVMRTSTGDHILDNLTGEIVLWNEGPYSFSKIQDPSDSGRWVKIIKPGDTLKTEVSVQDHVSWFLKTILAFM